MGVGLVSAARNAQIEYERKRLNAIINETYHVKLKLKEDVSINKRIAGILVINAWQESVKGRVKWYFSDPIGGQIKFEEDESGQYVCWVLYSKFNKSFLASHHPVRIWDYCDCYPSMQKTAREIEEEIQKLSDEMKKGMVYEKQPDENPILKEITELQKQMDSGAILEIEVPAAQKKLRQLTEQYQETLNMDKKEAPDRLTVIERTLKRSDLKIETREKLEQERAKLVMNEKENTVKVE